MDEIKNTHTGSIKDFGFAKNKICYLLTNKKRLNKGFLPAVTHRSFHDLAICYYLQYTNGKTEIITDSLAKLWNVDESELFNLAHKNTKLLNRGRVETISDVIDGTIMAASVQESESDMYDGFDISRSKTDFLPMYVVTNAENRYGAAVILYDGLLDAIAAKIGDFYALPSSIHEFICVPDTSGDTDYFAEMVRDINATKIPPEEFLSENIYHYSAGNHEFTIAT